MKILILGGSGSLGTELRKLNDDIIAPSHSECGISDYSSVAYALSKYSPDLVINCAAVIDNRVIEHIFNYYFSICQSCIKLGNFRIT